MTAPFRPFTGSSPPAQLANGVLHNGHQTSTAPARDVAEAAVARQLRGRVAERLTRATRAHEQSTDRPMPNQQRQTTIRDLISAVLDEYATAQMDAGHPPLRPDAESRIARAIGHALLGAGGLEPLLRNDQIEDIHADGCDNVTVRYTGGRRERVAPIADTDAEMVELIRRLAADAGRAEAGGEGGEERRWDRASPILTLQLPDGSRLLAVMSVVRRPSLSIRTHRMPRATMADLQNKGTINTVLRALLVAAVRARLNIIISGRVGSGKTTTLRALASAIPPHERLVTIEDTYELALDTDRSAHPDVMAMQVREANVEGHGAINAATLFRTGLRADPDRVFVGESRGDEVVTMLNALSQGNDGSLSTIHASSSAGTFRKLALYAAQAPERLDPAVTNLLIAEAVHLVVHLRYGADQTTRVVSSIREVVGADALSVASNEVFRPGRDHRAIPGTPPSTDLLTMLIAHGFDPRLLEDARSDPSGGWSR